MRPCWKRQPSALAAHGGAILTEQIVIPDGMIRDMVIEARFGGFPHRFTIVPAPIRPRRPDAPTPVDIPAVPAQVTQELIRTRETWHWPDGPPPSPAIFKGMPVIE